MITIMIITLTKHLHDVDQPPTGQLEGSPICGEMVLGVSGERGVAIYPGQSAVEVLGVAALIEREADDIGHYTARAIAREILRYLAKCRS